MRLSLTLDPREQRFGSDRTVLAKWFLRMLERVTGQSYAPIIPNTVSADRALVREIKRAEKLRVLGYDVEFTFLERFPDAPPLYICAGTYEGKDFNICGFDFTSRGIAMAKAVSELLERALWNMDSNYWGKGLHAPLREISGALPLEGLAGFSKEQRGAADHLFFNEQTLFRHTEGISLTDGKKISVPTQLVSARYLHEVKNEPLLRLPTTNGLATGTTFEEASYRGLLELIERDAFMIAFHNRMTPSRIDPSTIEDSRVQETLELLRRFNFLCDIMLLPTDMPTTVVAVVLRDPTGIGPALALGAKAHHDPATAVLGAIAESYIVWHSVRSADMYTKKDLPKKMTQFDRLAYWGKPENTELFSWFWSGKEVALPKGTTNARGLQDLGKGLAARGCHAVSVPMSPPELQKLGIHCVCVVSPELQPLYLDSDPIYLGGQRLHSIPPLFGYEAAKEPPSYPHPFP